MRNFRVKFLSEKNTGGYLVYALGEIMLIVVGILVALWIDNWNEDRQMARREQFYLKGLHTEFRTSLIQLDTLISVNQKSFQLGREALSLIPAAENRAQEVEISRKLITALYYEISYNPSNSVLAEILGSGRLETLTNPQLRQGLTSWDSFLESLDWQENNLEGIRKQVIDLVAGTEGSILTILDDSGMAEGLVSEERRQRVHSNLPVLQSLEFENKMLIFLLTAESMDSQFHEPLRRHILMILDEIESSLTDR